MYVENRVFLDTTISCLKYANKFVYTLNVIFSRINPSPWVDYPDGFLSYGVNDKANIENAIKDMVKAALTEYIKANFMLKKGGK